MRISSFLAATAFAASLAVSSGAWATDFSGIPLMPGQEGYDSSRNSQLQAQYPADPPVQQHFQRAQPRGAYDSPDFVVPPYEIEP